ncbi:hypothetical protein J31TS4_42350 [Paenibacillus sp. J31TS4]|uniref:S8 family serine peptidase n=1 Tax=Paenibacillus sp. J31TS4 TaxID=2807195 RepID=UPI001B11822C|nr:S8 family serine peptidase [Paenibacillus sp. J31TS4]GIP40955.1 hypothetical protein J31TS4_42350 [Paenibacillus sp. J31TS4]
MDWKRKWISLGMAALLLLSACLLPNEAESQVPPPDTRLSESALSWIIHWKDEKAPELKDLSLLDADYPEHGLSVARPLSGKANDGWLQHWQASPYVDYIEPNQTYQVARTVTDPLAVDQTYLKQIHAEKAWDYVTSNTHITIAVVDTGIDLTHPDLKANLVAGTNLVNPNLPPRDDNGHGTSVAGILAAVANNDKGVAGLLWNAHIMPIKALEANGNGDEIKLGEGIRYAVDNGAKIVVLSLGLNKPSEYMRSIVRYAEEKGVLLVAASGNEGNAVKYPAAYPTVLAVGGATRDNLADKRSNYGPELDLVAPWDVYTTLPEGDYGTREGTSMAAPQVAAVAAMILTKYPDMKPYQVRSMLRQSAQDLGTSGWDTKTGYGLLRADRALTMEYRQDFLEPNDRPEDAKLISISKQTDAVLADSKDVDWYAVDAPYDGTLSLVVESAVEGSIRLTHYPTLKSKGDSYVSQAAVGVNIPVKKGRSYFKLESAVALAQPLTYHLTTKFLIYEDPFENNDRQFLAYTLPPRSTEIKGTLHKQLDEDWFVMHVDTDGILRLKLSVDTARIDPVLLIQQRGEREIILDQKGDGETETSAPIAVTPGTYYFRISNIAGYTSPVVGEYTFTIDYSASYVDPNEPNDRPFEASVLLPGEEYTGLAETDEDVDWFRLKVEERSVVDFTLNDVPASISMRMALYDQALKPIQQTNALKGNQAVIRRQLEPGTYLLKLTPSKAFQDQLYRLKATVTPVGAPQNSPPAGPGKVRAAEPRASAVLTGP